MITKIKQTFFGVILAVAATLSACSVAYADTPKSHQQFVQEYCTNESKIAGAIMKNRQLGTSAVKMIELADGNNLWISYVEYAYSQPQYSTEEYRSKAENEFSNSVFIQCFKAGNKMKNSKNNSKNI